MAVNLVRPFLKLNYFLIVNLLCYRLCRPISLTFVTCLNSRLTSRSLTILGKYYFLHTNKSSIVYVDTPIICIGLLFLGNLKTIIIFPGHCGKHFYIKKYNFIKIDTPTWPVQRENDKPANNFIKLAGK